MPNTENLAAIIYTEIANYMLVTGKRPDAIFVNKTTLDKLAEDSNIKLSVEWNTLFGINAKEYIDGSDKPE